MTLIKFHQAYEAIIYSDSLAYEKDRRLAELMSDMEGHYDIPSLRKAEYEEKNRAIIALYRKISKSRSL
ncbi:hypothetical protein MUO14_15105 [Halobacillus shinanisalinarum]|uniref:Uncharacterized protein n=1 Tax=Halobacillus shinanisalinarum TaxID=2932258 RepID=A0ABY4GUM6_9BACI|nr:hypothetical protein [Halobacillus shinanisalinarum]UOQ91843.1 hypothetical protein MUO14_15105 [Halobacillus shinanisalinarum]